MFSLYVHYLFFIGFLNDTFVTKIFFLQLFFIKLCKTIKTKKFF
jgi:hypothetical protein